jgi:hypothetical protein
LQSGGDDFPGGRVPTRRRRSIIPYLILALIIIVIGLVAADIWLNWTISESMYQSKAGLDWFSIVFYGGLTFLVGGLLALFFLNPIPRRSDVFEAFNALMGLQYRNPYMGQYGGGQQMRRIRPMYIRPSRALWSFWQALKWVVLFGVFSASTGFPGLGNLPIVLDMASRGFGNWGYVPRIFELPLFPGSAQEIIRLMPTMEIQYQIIVYFSTVLMIVIALRFFLKFIRDVVIRAGDKWIRDIFVALTAIMFSVFIQVPYWAMDVRIPYEWGAVTTIMVAFFALAMFYHFKAGKESIPLAQRRRAGVIVAAIIIIGILLVNLGAYSFYTLNLTNNYVAYEWNPLTSKQVAVTQWAAGISNISSSSINNIPNGNMSKTLSLIRQWSSNASMIQSRNYIGVNWLQLTGNPQISFVNGQEYWVNPTTFNYPASNWQSQHLIYTYSSKIIVMNTHTGQIVPVTQAFNITSQPLMYYGLPCVANCSQTSPTNDGFSNDVYVGLNPTLQFNNVNYNGSADYTLCGAQRTIWFLAQGQFGYAFSPPQNCIEMLHNRNVFDRVGSILINGLVEDPDAYMVTDSNQPGGGNNLYFAIQVYIDYPLHSAFASGPSNAQNGGSPGSYLRLFGVVLVNIANGDMQGYYLGQNDNFLSSFYHEYYPGWGPAPSWLRDQLRYPQALLGDQNSQGQLDEDFIWRVNVASTFRSGADFFARPANTEVLYIPFVIGNNVSFAAVQLVQFAASSGYNLAGMYVAYGGDQLGHINLYEANFSTSAITFLGPDAATSAFTSDPTTRTAMTLDSAQEGNILLYPVNGQLYYFIPGYVFPSSTSGGATGVVVKNPFIDVISAEGANATVRFISTNSSLASNYGFSGVTTIATNSTVSTRSTYVENLFKDQSVSVQNVSSVNPSSVNVDQFGGNATYTLDSQNSTTTALVNSFISNYVKPSNVSSVFMWTPSPGTLDFGFIVNTSGISYLYYIQIDIGT